MPNEEGFTLRANKSTPNANAYRTLILGVIMCFMILIGFDPGMKMYDRFIREVPWIVADLGVIADEEGGTPLIKYAISTTVPTEGTWVSWVRSERGVRLCGGRGIDSYDYERGEEDGEVVPGTVSIWAWDEFLSRNCSVPPVPFYVCVQYAVNTRDTGIARTWGPYCSPLYDPRSQ